jgi:hypothetical protein
MVYQILLKIKKTGNSSILCQTVYTHDALRLAQFFAENQLPGYVYDSVEVLNGHGKCIFQSDTEF